MVIPDEYAQYCDEFAKLLFELETMWYSHLELVKEAKHGILVSSANARPVHSVPYRAERKGLKFEKNEITKLLKVEVI